ncbi:WD repeat and SOCS box-containing protein 2, partial [Ophiophagus hannah]
MQWAILLSPGEPLLVAELKPGRPQQHDWKSSCETWSVAFSADGTWFAWGPSSEYPTPTQGGGAALFRGCFGLPSPLDSWSSSPAPCSGRNGME